MKKLYKTITSLVLLSMLTLRLGAQLNGAYTINQTIAASPTNFVSFTALATALNASGVSGPVTVNVVTGTGPYNEQVAFNALTGSSSVNTITINGNGNTITFPGTTGAPWTIRLGGADYMFFNNLTAIGTGAAGQVCHLHGGSDNNRFTNCVFTLPANLTTTNMYPISISGSQTSATSLGLSGSNNIFSGCTTNSGRYAVVFYGNTSSPYDNGNQLINCNLLDFYQIGIYNYYMTGTIIRGNIFERPNRTTVTTTYGIYLNYNPGTAAVVEGNKIRRLFAAVPTSGSTTYGIYMANQNSTSGNEIFIRNNVISNISCNGQVIGYYNPGYPYDRFEHNTISLDDQASTSGNVYGVFTYAPAPSYVRNNVISINRTGTGFKYCLYYPTSGITSNRNVLWNNSPSGSNFIGYYNADFATLANWQSANGGSFDQSSLSSDPLFANPALFDFAPTALPINNLAFPLGLATDVTGLARNLPAPDAGAYEFFNTQCTSTPGANTVLTPTYVVCPSAISNLMLANSYSVNGISFQWQSSTNSPLGPFTPVSGATLAALSTTLANSAWFTVSLFCANGGSTITAAAGQVTVAGTTTNTPPYFEGFEGILGPEKLPNCSWSLSDASRAHTANQMISWMTPHSGSSYAYHGTNNNGFGTPQYHYTNGILLKAGVTYSAGAWYVTPGYATVNDFVLSYGATQTPTGQVVIATVSNPNNSQYALLTNTFTVPSTGLYYIEIKSTDNFNYDYFAWDDLFITIPCNIAPNSANLVVTGPNIICSGQVANLTASGVNTYTWVSGPNTPLYSPVTLQSTVYTAVGGNTLSGCTSTVTKLVQTNPLPVMSIIGSANSVCQGQPLTLVALGANTYSWSSGVNTPQTIVSPQSSTNYTVLGTNVFGCIGSAVMPVTVNQLPVIAVSGSTLACENELVLWTGSGASTYTWTSSSSFNVGTQVALAPMVSTNYVVAGTDANGCIGTTSRLISVEVCTGINAANNSAQNMIVYPNPNNGVFIVKMENGLNKTFEVTDVTGRVILTGATVNDQIDVNISNFANGVYYVKVKSDNKVGVVKVVKQ